MNLNKSKKNSIFLKKNKYSHNVQYWEIIGKIKKNIKVL